MEQNNRIIGKVKWFNIAKGFGFITTQSIDDDIFVQCKNAPKDSIVGTRRLLEGQEVSFQLDINANKGFEALEVHIENQFSYFSSAPEFRS